MRNLIYIGILSEPFFRINENLHSVYEIVYYTHGTGILKIGDKEFNFEPGSIICQPPGIPHSETSSKGFKNIFFSVEIFRELNDSIPCFKDNESKDLYHILNQIYREFHMKTKNWKKITDSLLDTIYQYMVAWSDKEEKNPLVERFENIIVLNISNKNFKIKNAIKDIPFTINHFRYLFKKETGKTPLDYLIEKRIESAKNLLETEHNNYTVKEISYRVGFEDPYYFSRVFKKSTGKSPTEWILSCS